MLAPIQTTGFPRLTFSRTTVRGRAPRVREQLRQEWVASGTLFAIALRVRRRSSFRRRSVCITWPCAGSNDELAPASQVTDNSLDLMSEMKNWWETLMASLKPGQHYVSFTTQDVSMLKHRMVLLHKASKAAQERNAQAEAQLLETGAELAVAQQEKKILEQQLEKARKQLELLTRYSEDLEDERDDAKKELKVKQKEWKSQTKELKQLLLRMQQTSGENIPDAATVSATVQAKSSGPLESPLIFPTFDAKVLDGLIPVSHMTLQDLQEECLVRGLSTEGGLAQVRGRVRVARAKERQLDAK